MRLQSCVGGLHTRRCVPCNTWPRLFICDARRQTNKDVRESVGGKNSMFVGLSSQVLAITRQTILKVQSETREAAPGGAEERCR